MLSLLEACQIIKNNFSGYKYFIQASETEKYFLLTDIGDNGEILFDATFFR